MIPTTKALSFEQVVEELVRFMTGCNVFRLALCVLVAGFCAACAVVTDVALEPTAPRIVPPPVTVAKKSINERPPSDLSQYPYRGSTVAILTFDARAGVSAAEVALLVDRFEAEFNKVDVQKPVSRAKMKQILELQQFSSTCGSTDCAVEAGQLLNVEYMIYGTVGRINRTAMINVFMTSVESGEVVASSTVDYEGRSDKMASDGARLAVNGFLRAVMAKASRKQGAAVN